MMSRKTRISIIAAVVVVLLGQKVLQRKSDDPLADGKRKPAVATAIAPAKPRMYGAIAFTPCTLRSFMSRDSLEAQCATFEVPEDHARPGGRKIALNLAWLPATNEADATPDPLFMLAGGPGQAAVETFPAPRAASRSLAKASVRPDSRMSSTSSTSRPRTSLCTSRRISTWPAETVPVR